MLEPQTVTQPEGELMPSLNHSYICAQIMRQLLQYDEFQPLPELTLDIDNGLTPDISVFPKDQIQPNFFEDVAKVQKLPLLAIEVISSSQNIPTMLDKARLLLKAGVQVVWTIEPYGRSVFVSQAQGEQLFHEDKVESEGITVNFAQVFRN